MFVSALREALLAGDIDLAVHSAKDLPVVPAEGIVIGAVRLERIRETLSSPETG